MKRDFIYAVLNSITDKTGSGVSTTQVGNPFDFQRRRRDIETGLMYFRARMYDPVTGHWLQRDPMGLYPGANWHETFLSTPVMLTDPLGEDPPKHDRKYATYKPTSEGEKDADNKDLKSMADALASKGASKEDIGQFEAKYKKGLPNGKKVKGYTIVRYGWSNFRWLYAISIIVTPDDDTGEVKAHEDTHAAIGERSAEGTTPPTPPEDPPPPMKGRSEMTRLRKQAEKRTEWLSELFDFLSYGAEMSDENPLTALFGSKSNGAKK